MARGAEESNLKGLSQSSFRESLDMGFLCKDLRKDIGAIPGNRIFGAGFESLTRK
jgi:hypothetical protein